MRVMPILTDGRKYLELRNAVDEPMVPATELKSGEDARAAARRAVEQFFGMDAPEDAFKEGFQGRVSLTQEVVAVYPVDASKMDMALLRPVEDAATWAWKDLPDGVGEVVALGFPRNQPRLNSADLAVDDTGTRAGAGVARNNRLITVVDAGGAEIPTKGGALGAQPTREEALAQYHSLAASVADKAAGLHSVPSHERGAREAELAQEAEDLRLLAADLGIEAGSGRMNSEKKKHRVNALDVPCSKCGAPSGLDYKPSGNAKALCEKCYDEQVARLTKTTKSNATASVCPRGGSHDWVGQGPEKYCDRCGTFYKDIERENAAAEGFPDNKPTTARALIKANDGTIIAARQRDGRSLLPGGHLEDGETAESAVARELQEELGLDIKSALTGESYVFNAEDGSSHRVFVVDAGKLDLSKLQPGDDVEEIEMVNSPFTDSHGQTHPPARENAMATCAECGHVDGQHDGLRGKCFDEARPGDTKAVAHPADGFKRCSCQRFVRDYGRANATNYAPNGFKVVGQYEDENTAKDQASRIPGAKVEENPAGRAWRVLAPEKRNAEETGTPSGFNCPKCAQEMEWGGKANGKLTTWCKKCNQSYGVAQVRGNDGGGDVQEIERHVEGIEHELGEMGRDNGEKGYCICGHSAANHENNGIGQRSYCLQCFDVDKCAGFRQNGDVPSAERFEANATEHQKELKMWEMALRDAERCGDATDVAQCKQRISELKSKISQGVSSAQHSRANHIEELPNGKFRLLSHDGKNLGTFDSHAAAAKHEGEVEYFKEHKNDGIAEPGPSSPPNILEASY